MQAAPLPRVGLGYDVHRLVPGRPLILGGVKVPHPLGLLGHSDADVLCHAIADALLGAACLGDLGGQFPDDDPRYQGASSLALLAEVGRLVAAEGYRPGNLDSVVVCQAPLLAPYLPQMRAQLAGVLALAQSAVSVKASCTEGLGFAGQGAGIAAYATVILVR